MDALTQNGSTPEESRQLQRIAIDLLGLDLGRIERTGTTANMSGIHAGRYQLTRRTDSRSLFLQDAEYQSQGRAGVFEGRDDELLDRAQRLLEELGIDPAEIDRRSIMTEQVEAASFDRRSGDIVSAGVRDGKRYAYLTRAVDGLPIWQSSLTLGLTRDGAPGYLHLHWPEIPAKYPDLARDYRKAEAGGWTAPKLDYAEPESIRAGVLHSPAISLVLDHAAAIKVVYRPTTSEIGKKPVRYVDVGGADVLLPRHFDETPGPIDKQRPTASAA
jgi:hypothetical protein